MTDEKVIMLIQAKIQPERRAELLEAARQYLSLVRAEPGVEAFYLTARKDDPNTFVFYEIYRSQAAQDFHLQQDFTRSLSDAKKRAGWRTTANKSCQSGRFTTNQSALVLPQPTVEKGDACPRPYINDERCRGASPAIDCACSLQGAIALAVEDTPEGPAENVGLRLRRNTTFIQHVVIAVQFAIKLVEVAFKNVRSKDELLESCGIRFRSVRAGHASPPKMDLKNG